MMRAVVLDASVAVKLVIDEEYSAQAAALLRDSAWDAIAGPPHLLTEVGNALYQRTRRKAGSISQPHAERGLSELLALDIALVSPPNLYTRAMEFANLHSLRNIYDSLYVVLAETLGAELWTADQVLLRSVSAAAPWVRWIGDYPQRRVDAPTPQRASPPVGLAGSAHQPPTPRPAGRRPNRRLFRSPERGARRVGRSPPPADRPAGRVR